MADKNSVRRDLPIDLSSIVTSVETITRELTRKLSHQELTDVIAGLCERLRRIPDERNRPKPLSPQ